MIFLSRRVQIADVSIELGETSAIEKRAVKIARVQCPRALY